MDVVEISLLRISMEKFLLTFDEVMNALWKAYADPYVANGVIQFRHIWKHVEIARAHKKEQFNFTGLYREPNAR